MTTPGLRVDQVADAFTSVPGVTIEALNKTPGASRTTTSSSFVEIGSPTGELTQTFTVPVAGTYLVQFGCALYTTSSGSASEVRFRLNIDGGAQIVGTDDRQWSIWCDSSVSNKTFAASIVLAAGNHTICPEWKRVSGTGTLTVDAGLPFFCQLTLVSGSGAGGMIKTETIDSGDRGPGSGVTPSEVTQLATVVTTSAGEVVQLSFTGSVYPNSGAAQTLFVYYQIDSGGWITMIRCGDYAGFANNASWMGFPTVTTAGLHTFKLAIANENGGNWLLSGATAPSRLTVLQFRGGLVPIRKDGVSITDTPAAINFVGPGCQVTNVGGTATVALMGAEGLISDSVYKTGGNQTIDTTYPYWEDITELELTVVTTQNERLLVDCLADMNVPYTSPFIGIFVDDVLQKKWFETGGGAWELCASFSVITSALSAGSHTVKIKGARQGSETATLYGSSNSWMTVTRFRGGYVHPENVPILEYNSTTVVNVKAGPGASTELRALLNDGRRYTHTGTLTFDITASGLGGRDTGAESDDLWYLYLVPGAISGDLAVVGSITAPSTGPTGYPVWRYIGSVRNSTDILKFYQDGAYFANAVPGLVLNTGAGGADGAIQTCTLTGYVPVTASAVDVQVYWKCNGTGEMHCFVYGDEDISTITTRWNTSKLKAAAPLTNGGQCVRGMIPLPAATKRFMYIRDGFLNSRIEIQGWVDGWLSGKESQLQAGGGGWTTFLDLDFSALPNQSLGADGAVSIAGKDWTKINSANDQAAMAIVGGSGLVIQPKSTSDYYVGVRTLPAITIPLTTLIPNVDLSAPIRVTAYVSAINRVANYDGFVISIENPTPQTWFDARINYENEVRVAAVHVYYNGALGNIGVGALSGKNVVQIELPSGIQQMLACWRAGDWSAGWPAPSSLLPYAYRAPTGATMYPLYTGANNYIGPATAWNLLVGAMRAGSGTALSVTVSRIKIEAKIL